MTTLKLDVSHTGLGMEFTELPFASTLTLAQVKDKLYPRTGTEVQHQQLSLGERVLDDDTRTLSELGVVTGDRLVLVDTNEGSVANTLFDGAAAVPKVVASRGDSGFAAFRKKAKAKATADTGRDAAALLNVGQRVVVKKSGAPGVVRFVGPCDAMPAGFWVGVELDDSSAGKHDGEVKGVRLFGPCASKGGICTRPDLVVAEASTVEEGGGKEDDADEEL